MAEQRPRWRRILGVARLAVGPPLLALIAAIQSVRVTGIATVALIHPQSPWTQAVADVLVALALGTIALWTACAVAGRRPPLSFFVVPVASAQLPLAALALVMGRRILGGVVVSAAAGRDGEEFIAHPELILRALGPTAIAAVLLTILVVGALYVAYRRITRLQGWRLPVSFAGGLIGAEVCCRLWAWWAS